MHTIQYTTAHHYNIVYTLDQSITYILNTTCSVIMWLVMFYSQLQLLHYTSSNNTMGQEKYTIKSLSVCNYYKSWIHIVFCSRRHCICVWKLVMERIQYTEQNIERRISHLRHYQFLHIDIISGTTLVKPFAKKLNEDQNFLGLCLCHIFYTYTLFMIDNVYV